MTETIFSAIQRCTDLQSLRETMFAFFGQHGFDRIGFGAPSRNMPGAMTIVERGYPASMIGRYHGERMHHQDPFLSGAITSGLPQRWREVVRQAGLTATERMVSGGQLDSNTIDGLTIPTFGRAGSSGVVYIGTLDDPSVIDNADLPLLQAVAQQGHLRLDQIAQERAPVPALSPREREILFWVGQHKSNTDIGTILSISPATIATYLKRVFLKLEAKDRVTAVTRAVETGQIWI